jgi:hypothetical protein
MLNQLIRVVLLVALLAALVASNARVFAGHRVCSCFSSKCEGKGGCSPGGCTFDKKTGQCVNTGCTGLCY